MNFELKENSNIGYPIASEMSQKITTFRQEITTAQANLGSVNININPAHSKLIFTPRHIAPEKNIM